MKENFLNYIPLKIYRFLRWQLSERKNYFYNKNNFSKEYAQICYNVDKVVRKNVSREIFLAMRAKKDSYIIKYLEDLCRDVIEKYKDKSEICSSSLVNKKKKIWVFWWAGEDMAPDIVKACIKSIRKNSSGHEVVMLDKNNYQNYISLSKIIIEKHNKGIIGHAHFSDLIRLTLLAQYGGMWIDATVFISQPLPPSIFNMWFYTAKTLNQKSVFFSKSRWCGYFLAGNSNFPLFSFARDCLTIYWESENAIIDYLLMDYIFELAYENIVVVRNTIDNLPDNNFKRGVLMSSINETYSKELFDVLATQETFVSKLSWRYGNPQLKTRDGKMSNYGYLLKL